MAGVAGTVADLHLRFGLTARTCAAILSMRIWLSSPQRTASSSTSAGMLGVNVDLDQLVVANDAPPILRAQGAARG